MAIYVVFKDLFLRLMITSENFSSKCEVNMNINIKI